MLTRQRGMETTTTTRPAATHTAATHTAATHTAAIHTALPEFTTDLNQDLEFARRSVRYMVDNWCEAAEIIDALTVDLGLTADAAHALLRDTTSLVAA